VASNKVTAPVSLRRDKLCRRQNFDDQNLHNQSSSAKPASGKPVSSKRLPRKTSGKTKVRFLPSCLALRASRQDSAAENS